MTNSKDEKSSIPAGFVPNKALGQNFLIDGSVIDGILDEAQISGKRVLEIGPGAGALTQGLLQRAAFLAAIEKDGRLCDVLHERFGARLMLLHADVLDANIPLLMGNEPWHAVGNLPYYATTPIVFKLLSLLPQSMTLMVQKEAAQRFSARPRDRVYGPVAVTTACFYNAREVIQVPRSCFQPQPEVDSVVVRLERNNAAIESPAAFLTFLKQAFSMRRKTLFNVLGKEPLLPELLASLHLNTDVRAEALSPDILLQLYRTLCNKPLHEPKQDI